jgi:hypothetical protein
VRRAPPVRRARAETTARTGRTGRTGRTALKARRAARRDRSGRADGSRGSDGPQGPPGSGPTTVRKTTLQSASGLNLALAANTTYSFEYYILFASAQANNGIGLAVTGPGTPAVISYTVDIPIGNDGRTGTIPAGELSTTT